MQVYNDEHLCHYGVKGMKWGHRKARIGINDKGNLSIVDKTNKKGVKKFILKMSIFASAMGISIYLKNHPKTLMKGMDVVSNILKKEKEKEIGIGIVKDSHIFSKKLGRLLTIEEATTAGFM